VARPPRGTTAVLNLCRIEDPYSCEAHAWEPIPDSAPAPSLDWLRRMVEFVDANRRAGRTTFVHCRAGVSRSGMVVAAYLMFKNKWGRDEALDFVRSKRPSTQPNPAFMQLLAEWERALRKQGRRHAPALSDRAQGAVPIKSPVPQ
jgi:protein-tyrosine phosphatase